MTALARTFPYSQSPALYNKSAGSALATLGNDPAGKLRRSGYGSALAILYAREALKRLRSLGDNWDGFGSVAPTALSQFSAQRFIETAFGQINETNFQWMSPTISADESGAYVFEWWRGTKKLSVYADSNGVDFIRVWGVDSFNEMNDGPIDNDEEIKVLWVWLNS